MDAWAAFSQRKRDLGPEIETFVAPSWPTAARQVTCVVWARRVLNETHSVELAQQLRRALECTGLLSAPLAQAIDRLEGDERSHVELARRFLVQLGGEAPVVPPLLEDEQDPHVLLLRCVVTGLLVCETVSAARFRHVRQHTDLEIPRACIELFLRDEIAHAELGFSMFPFVFQRVESVLGANEARRVLEAELRGTFRHLDLSIGLDAERRAIALEPRRQIPGNAGVVEPLIDACAFYEAIRETILPRLTLLGVDAKKVWDSR